LTDHSNPKAYLQQFRRNGLKFKALGMLLNHLLNRVNISKLYIDDIDYFVDSLFKFVECGKNEL
jgi:DNA mismatch repair ATPase MutS